MKINKFDVVELKNGNRATILGKENNGQYMGEIVNPYGITVDKKLISNEDITKIVCSKERMR